MAGLTRDVEPVPILLRGGDVIVMSGDARQCYHGIPRVFSSSSSPLPGSRSDEVSDDYLPFARHMENCRINISIRST